MNQTLLGGARAMMQHSGVTKGFWAEAMGTAAHILNRAPRKSLGWRTPYEILFGQVPDVSYLHIFGCRAWVFNDQGKKWDPKSKPMILVGYEIGSKAYRLWNPVTRSIVVSANVRFDENVLPNKPAATLPKVPTEPIATSSKLPPPTSQDYIRVRDYDDDEFLYPTTVPPAPSVHLPTPAPSAGPSAPPNVTAPPPPIPPVMTPSLSRPSTPAPDPDPQESDSEPPAWRSKRKGKAKASALQSTEPEGAALDVAYLNSVKLFVQDN